MDYIFHRTPLAQKTTENLANEVDALVQASLVLLNVEPRPDGVIDAIDDERMYLTAGLVERTATASTPWYVSDECGVPVAMITGVAPYHPDYNDSGGYNEGIWHEYGLVVDYLDGHTEICNSLHQDSSDVFDCGGGPWDGNFYTISQTPFEKDEG
jgi:hypothetical protein